MKFIYLFFFLFSFHAIAQEDFLAKEYFKNGEFEKAQLLYKTLHQKNPTHYVYLIQLVKTHQQLEQLDQSQELLQNSTLKNPALFVELGYNYQLKNDLENANLNYNKAIEAIDIEPNAIFYIARAFEDHSLLEQAIAAYEKAIQIKPEYNFNIQLNLSKIYGEQGKIEKMFSSYIEIIQYQVNYTNTIKRAFSEFISEDKNNPNNIILKKILLKKIQETPDLLFNNLLSWLFIQQKEYYKAFTQEKAIFKRDPVSLDRIESIALIAANENQDAIAIEIFEYIIKIAQDPEITLQAENHILQIKTKNAAPKDYADLNKKYLDLLETYGKHQGTLDLQVAYAHFLAFNLNNTQQATLLLKESLKQRLSSYHAAKVKLELADILVFQEKFNEALIYYTQIQRSLKNSTISQEARFKVAKTSYYKGDFKWAESQLKILKSSTSQLIANDALDLKLLISDNKYEDSTQTALKLYAKADLFAFQNKTDQAISLLDTILEAHKTETIIDQALYKQAQLFESKKQYQKAADNYKLIITNYKEEILADDALFYLAKLYNDHLMLPEKAKELYEQIIFNHQDSIYFVEARKNYRMLRGDAIN
ncbi:tetratricopeptide repeat protein [Lacinutrix sp. C3R15]|uniref:tetratricopeptide repeat protein n=1 Tax=Flavobacteriaceae TaxID=49546 RepID=UPI001C09CDF3|nr:MULTISPECIES: tetratricopeptide repeat protein [Flavobacteriaceae]MBU2938291.1 tetratricopeptide repeat protein [Lacinutrix sp. C3R15]MDO6621605.1 tetratricopeptide repeat protein [Oceanihabitans sp. 1_MG-2023]